MRWVVKAGGPHLCGGDKTLMPIMTSDGLIQTWKNQTDRGVEYVNKQHILAT